MTTIFFRLLAEDDKAAGLGAAVAAVRGGQHDPIIHMAEPDSLRQVPGSPFAYWVSERIRRKFAETPTLESGERVARRGPSTGDDSRRVRAWWEVPPREVGRLLRWVPFSKGGSYSPYYADIHLLVAWDEARRTFRDFWGRPGRMIERPESLEYFFRPGLTWSLRSQRGLSMRAMPAGCVFGHKGPAVFADDDALPSLLGLTNSDAFHQLVTLQMAFGSYEVGVIQRTPAPNLSEPHGIQLSENALSCVALRRGLDRANETSHIFCLPWLLQLTGATLSQRLVSWRSHIKETEQQLAERQRDINDNACQLYGMRSECQPRTDATVGEEGTTFGKSQSTSEVDAEDEDENEAESLTTYRFLTVDLVSYAIGVALGRWDVRLATDEREAGLPSSPFAPLPVCSPGMLTGEDALPLRESPPGYPLVIDWDGILTDAPDHADDVMRRVQDIFGLVFGERAESIEGEACEILGVSDLREYFRSPSNGGFWMDHVRRYSKSRRKAPIYWLLQSSKRNYALWLYYYRLDKDILFKALVNYVEPKLRLEQSRLEQMRKQKEGVGSAGREAKEMERQIDRQEALLTELRDFEAKLRRAAELRLEPDLNDGVVLNIAPLWELVPWAEPKKYWEELLAGKYEWSSIGKQLLAKGMIK